MVAIRSTLSGAIALLLGSAPLTLAQIDPYPRSSLQLGYDQSLSSQGPQSLYAYYHYNNPALLRTNMALGLAVAPIYLDGELGFRALLSPHTDVGIAISGGGFGENNYAIRQGHYFKDESFDGHGGGASLNLYHLINPAQLIPLHLVVQGGTHYSTFSATDKTADQVQLPADRMNTFVRGDSSAVVRNKFGVAGDSFFAITRGTGKPLAEEGASIVSNEQFQSALGAVVEEIRREALLVVTNVNSGLDTWTKLRADLGGTRQHLDALTQRMENIAAAIEAGKGTVRKLLTDTSLADEAQKLLARANDAMGDLLAMITNLNVVVKNIQDGTVRLPEITEAVANEAKDLPGLVQQTQNSMRELERLVEALQRHWLMGKYVNKTNPPPSQPLLDTPRSEKKPVGVLRSPRDSTR